MMSLMSDHRAKFSVGQLIHHRLFDYRGIIFDVDPGFQGQEDWYEQMAKSRPPKDRPWYHVLVDGENYTTYVAERNIEPDQLRADVHHPLVDQLFERLDEGTYLPRISVN